MIKQPPDTPEDDRDSHPLRRVSMRSFESLIDQQIRAAEEAGQFRDLPGAGKPLNLQGDEHVPEDLRTGFRMLKNAGYAPSWIELQQSIRAEQERLASWLAQVNRRWPSLGQIPRDQVRAEYETYLCDLNKQITHYNLIAPPVAGQLPLIQLWRELLKLGAE